RSREVVVRGLHSEDEAREAIAPVSRAAVNLRRAEGVGRSVVLLTPGAFELAASVDVALAPVGTGLLGDEPTGAGPCAVAPAAELPWRVGDRAILRDPGSRRIWSVRVVDVDPLPLRRRGAPRRRAEALAAGDSSGSASGLAALRLRSRSADTEMRLRRLDLPV